MNNFELIYGPNQINNFASNYSTTKKEILEIIFKKEACKIIYSSIMEKFNKSYAERLVGLIRDNKISITDISHFIFSERVLNDSETTIYKISQKGYLRTNNNCKNVINSMLGEIHSYILSLIKADYEEINLRDIIPVLALYHKKFEDSKVVSNMIKDRLPRSDIFCAFLKTFVNTFTVKSPESQNIFIDIMDEAYFEKYFKRYEIATESTPYTINYEEYFKFLILFVDIVSALSITAQIRTPIFRVYLATKNEKREKILEYLCTRTGLEKEKVVELLRSKDITTLAEVNSEDINFIIEASLDKLIEEELLIDLNKILALSSDLKVINENIKNMMEKTRLKNTEYIYYDVNTVSDIGTKKLSETTIDYNDIYDKIDNREAFLSKLSELYIDAQTVNQVKREISTNCPGYALHTKVINVPEEMYIEVYRKVREETSYLTDSFYDNFTFEINII